MSPGSTFSLEARAGYTMTSLSFEAAALSAAFLWAFGGLIAAGPAKALGGPRFTRLRMYWVAFALIVIATIFGDWSSLGTREVLLLGSSGIFGLALGDAALFTAFSTLGPRRTSILFAANAPMTAALSAVIFGERFSPPALVGSGLVMVGVTLAIAFGTRPGQNHHWEEVRGKLGVGVGFGLLGAAGQAIGVLLADPAFENGLDPWAGAAVRAMVGLAALVAMRGYFEKRALVPRPIRIGWKLWGAMILSGTIGMVFGKTLVLIALSNGDPGIVSILIATAPAIQLPLIWIITRERPAAGAWIGALLASAGNRDDCCLRLASPAGYRRNPRDAFVVVSIGGPWSVLADLTAGYRCEIRKYKWTHRLTRWDTRFLLIDRPSARALDR